MSTKDKVAGAVNTGSSLWQKDGDESTRQALVDYLDAMNAFPLIRLVARRSLEALNLAPGARVLEVGCGAGTFLPLLTELVGETGRVTALDHAPDFVDTARRRVHELGLDDRVEVIEGDALDLPFPDASFDAAHCERVLMHLDDPTAALREMQRVVRPGGVVVAAETDWAGIRIDHPDREAFDLLYRRWLGQVRQPAMGLELRRRMTGAGLVDVQAEPIVVGAYDISVLTAAGLNLGETADALAAEGQLDRERSRATMAWLESAGKAGTFFNYGGIVVAWGTVPAS